MDPITIIVSALAAGGAAGLSDTAAQAIKDAYAGLKSLIQRKHAAASPAVSMLESDPGSQELQGYVEKQLAKTDAGQDAELLQQAKATVDAVATYDPEAARTVGIDLQGIKGASLKLSDVTATGTGPTTGVRVKDAEISGDIEIKGVHVGSQATKPQPASQAPPARIKILFLAANPTDTARLALDEEVRAIDQALQLARFRDAFDLQQAHAVRVADLQGLLMRYQPHIVHFSGHGSETGAIILQDDRGRATPVPPQALTNVFALLKDNMRVVVLNACFSQPQAEAIAQHVDCVVGMSEKIEDKTAIVFAAAFYQALAFGRNVQSAFALARNQAQLEGLTDEHVPQLLAPHGDPAQVTFAQR